MKEFFGKYKNLYVTVPFLLCFILYLGALSKYKPPGAYIRRGDLTEGFLRDEFEGLIFGGAYTWRGLYMEGLIFGILRYFELSPDICITEVGITEVVLLFIRFTCVKNLNLVLFSKYLVDSNIGVLNKWYNLENKDNANNAIKYFRKSSLSDLQSLAVIHIYYCQHFYCRRQEEPAA